MYFLSYCDIVEYNTDNEANTKYKCKEYEVLHRQLLNLQKSLKFKISINKDRRRNYVMKKEKNL